MPLIEKACQYLVGGGIGMPLPLHACRRWQMRRVTYIATGEITSLKHEVGDHTMELGALVSEPFLASAKGAEVLGRFRGDVIVEEEVDSAFLFCSRKFSTHAF